MVNAKQKRIAKSREHNPLWMGNKVKKEEPLTKRKKLQRSEDFEESVSYSFVVVELKEKYFQNVMVYNVVSILNQNFAGI